MSIDIYLQRKTWLSYDEGKTYIESLEDVFSTNITHNLGKMATEAGIYEALWRPEEIPVQKAYEIIPVIEKGLADMKARPDHYRQFSASNGWGTYDQFIPWIQQYLNACIENPESFISVSR